MVPGPLCPPRVSGGRGLRALTGVGVRVVYDQDCLAEASLGGARYVGLSCGSGSLPGGHFLFVASMWTGARSESDGSGLLGWESRVSQGGLDSLSLGWWQPSVYG